MCNFIYDKKSLSLTAALRNIVDRFCKFFHIVIKNIFDYLRNFFVFKKFTDINISSYSLKFWNFIFRGFFYLYVLKFAFIGSPSIWDSQPGSGGRCLRPANGGRCLERLCSRVPWKARRENRGGHHQHDAQHQNPQVGAQRLIA